MVKYQFSVYILTARCGYFKRTTLFIRLMMSPTPFQFTLTGCTLSVTLSRKVHWICKKVWRQVLHQALVWVSTQISLRYNWNRDKNLKSAAEKLIARWVKKFEPERIQSILRAVARWKFCRLPEKPTHLFHITIFFTVDYFHSYCLFFWLIVSSLHH